MKHVNPDDGHHHVRDIPGRQEIVPAPPRIALGRYAVRTRPNPALAAALSLVVPGAGQLYAGRPGAAVVWFGCVMVGLSSDPARSRPPRGCASLSARRLGSPPQRTAWSVICLNQPPARLMQNRKGCAGGSV